jgi:hypothetical protein
VTYDISLAPPRLQHMPPAALALAILLHVLLGVAISGLHRSGRPSRKSRRSW